ncbi:MAG: hypothetical protein ACLP01_26290 [Solirubrobacteraceae bacterium]
MELEREDWPEIEIAAITTSNAISTPTRPYTFFAIQRSSRTHAAADARVRPDRAYAGFGAGTIAVASVSLSGVWNTSVAASISSK